MGSWNLKIDGTGPHHNGKPYDVERQSAEFVARLKGNGHNIGEAVVTINDQSLTIGAPEIPASPVNMAQEAYEAYCGHTQWKSLVSGADLPPWASLTAPIRAAWEVSTAWVVGKVLRDNNPLS